MECYHPENNEWTDMPAMRYPRSGAGVAVLNQVSKIPHDYEMFYGPKQLNDSQLIMTFSFETNSMLISQLQYIYVVGGFDGTRQLSSVERFDTDNRVWETVTPMKTSRSALSVNVIDGKLYAMVN